MRGATQQWPGKRKPAAEGRQLIMRQTLCLQETATQHSMDCLNQTQQTARNLKSTRSKHLPFVVGRHREEMVV